MVKLLTDAAVRKYAPGPERRVIRDGGARSLYLIVEPSGAKSWMMRFRRPNGKPAKLVLGLYDLSGHELTGDPQIGQPLSLAAARALAAAVHRRRALGEDVIADHKASKHRRKAEQEQAENNSYAAAVRRFIDEYAKPKTRRWHETARLLGLNYTKNGDAEPEEAPGGLVQRWRDRPLRSIDGHDIWSVIDEARRVGVPGIDPRTPGLSEARPRALLAALSAMCTWAQHHRFIDANPCSGLHRPATPKSRDRVLSADEIRWFWRAHDSVDVTSAPRPFAPLLRLLLITGARLNEVAGMTKNELSDDGATWNLPGDRTKNHRPHVVPLPPLARELIENVASKPGPTGYVFTTTGRTPVSGWSRAKNRLDEAMLAIARKERGKGVTIAPWRLHDLRRTAVTGMAELGIRPDVIELCVNHVSGSRGGIAGVYNKSELLRERRAALERWSAHLHGLVSGKPMNVTALRRGLNHA